MVREHDPRRLELELAQEAEVMGRVAGMLEGPTQRSFARQARMLERMVGTLRSARR